MTKTLFPIEQEREPLVIELTGYALASEVTRPGKRCGQPPVVFRFLDVESFRESREEVESYAEEWGDEDMKIVRVKVVATEDVT